MVTKFKTRQNNLYTDLPNLIFTKLSRYMVYICDFSIFIILSVLKVIFPKNTDESV